MSPKKGELVVAELRKGSEKGLALAKQILLAEKMEPPKLYSACEYYVEHWNDFTHAGLFSMACEAVGGNPEESVLVQAAIAIMAASFDLHDDILDKDKTKNNIPTVYGEFGLEITLLLGDAFLIEGFKTLMDSIIEFPRQKVKNILEKTRNLFFEVGNAHSLEVCLKKGKRMTLNDYLMITERKGASIEADMMFGAFFGGGDEDEVANLAKLGRIIGILCILRDDVVDVFDIEELRQRITVQDLPLPLHFAMQDDKINPRVNTLLSRPKITRRAVAELVDLTLQSEPVEKLKKKMRLLIEEGLTLLKNLKKRKLARNLQAVLTFMLEDL